MIHLFRKNDKNNKVTPQSEEPGAQESDVQLEETKAETAENATPQLSRVELDRLVREEARRLRVTEHLLSAPHLQRVQDTLRLNETKLNNVEENLMRTREQKDRLRRFKELQGEMEVQRAHLFEVNKQAASMLGDKRELDRFETFENIQGRFQRLQILELQRRDEKHRESTLAGEIELLLRELGDEQKRLRQCMDEADESEKALQMAQTAVNNSLRLEGGNDALAYARQKAQEFGAQLASRCLAMEKQLQEEESAIEELKRDIEKKRTRLQSTEAHQRMVEHSELLVDMLGRLNVLKEKSVEADTRQRDAERRQRTENDLLGRVFMDYQQVEAQIKTISDELLVHRQNIHGQDSYQLQERAMRLKRRRQMLKSAQALWRRIQTLYEQLENRQQEMNSLRLHMEHTAENARRMELELGVLRRSHREKEYTFTLSKSQNVIQLRSDLKEGVSCTVCGATHHPYHSDTMLEQNKLIGELKTESEMLQTELRNKEAELLETRLDLERTTTLKKAIEDELITLRSLQNEAVKDWAMYAELDGSFHSCDSSTNAEARTAMLRQLIENIETDVRTAQEELDNYNFHQGRINELTEQMVRLEQSRNELTTRMNEVNTGCQVLARETDWLSTRRQELTDEYGRLFDTVDKMMTFPDWQTLWNRGVEGIIMRIQELSQERGELTKTVSDQESRLETLTALKEQNAERLAELRQNHQVILDAVGDYENLTGENNKELERLLEGKSPKQYNDDMLNLFLENRKRMEQQRTVTDRKQEDFLHAKGKLEELEVTAGRTDGMATSERSALDIWIRQYNASHSPVQYSELEHFFGQERDWTSIREQIRSTDMDARLTQAKVDHLRSQMVALQAEGNIPDGDTTEALLALAKQEEVLEKRRMDAMLLIATNTLTLQAHEKAEGQIKGEKMKEPSPNGDF